MKFATTLSTSTLSTLLVFSVTLVALSNSLPLAHADTFGNPIVLDNSAGDQTDSHVASSGDNVYTSYSSQLNGVSNVIVTTTADKGASFSTKTFADGNFEFLSDIAASGDNVYVTWTDVTSDKSVILLAKSTDRGATYSDPVQISTSDNSRVAKVAVSGNNVYAVWQDFGTITSSLTPDIFFAVSTNGGASFSTPVNLSNSPGTLSKNPSLAAFGNNVYVVWTDCDTDGTNCKILYSKSSNAGASFTTAAAVSAPAPESTLPDVKVSQDKVYVVYGQVHNVNGGQKRDVVLLKSIDSGITFGSPVNLSGNLPGIDDNNPHIDVFGDVVAITWEDRIATPSPHWEIYFTGSTDAANTLSNPISISGSSLAGVDSTLNDVTLSGMNVYSAWSVLNNNFDIYFVAGIITQSDTTPPHTFITSAVDGNGASVLPGSSTLSTSIRISFTGTDNVAVAGFQCSIDGHAFSTCVSPVTLNDLTTGTHTFQVRAIDTSNNVDPMPVTFSWTVLTPTQGIQQLIHVIQTMGLSQGTQASLIAHLNAALAALASNNNPTACNVLGAFTNEVNAQIQSGHLTASQGSQLIQSAQAIEKALGC